MAEIAIRTDKLSRDFGPVRAVDNLSLEVPAGIIFGFLGPNASGKTTTINLLLGLLEPTSGRAEVLGFDVRTRADEVRSLSGALLEHTGLYEQLSAEDNLEFYAGYLDHRSHTGVGCRRTAPGGHGPLQAGALDSGLILPGVAC